MPGSDMTHKDVKHICDELECSPVAQFTDSPYGGPANLTPLKVAGHIAMKSHNNTGGALGMKSLKSTKVPGYKGKFAKKAHQV